MNRLSALAVIAAASLLFMARQTRADGGACPAGSSHKTTICHVPPGNLQVPQTICVGDAAVRSHLAKHPGDSAGPCGPRCGDGQCSGEENCSNCPEDCGACPPRCGDGQCNGDEDCASCAEDCGECPPQCGDGKCNGDENCVTCPEDCSGGTVCCQGAGSCSVAACCEACPAGEDLQCAQNGVCSIGGTCQQQ